MNVQAFGIFDAYKFGFRALGKNFLLLLGTFGVIGLAMLGILLAIHLWFLPLALNWGHAAEATSTSLNVGFNYSIVPAIPIVLTPVHAFMFLLALFLIAFVGMISKMFLVRIGLDSYERGSSSFERLKASLPMIGTFWLATILIYIVTFFGFILLIIPGFIFLVKYGFADFVVMDTDLGPVEALKRSGEITYGHKWRVFGYYFLGAIIGALSGILALIFLCVFLFGRAYIYRKLVENWQKDKAQFTSVPPNM